MIVETLRMLKAALTDPLTGVAAMIAQVPTEAGQTIPALAAIVEETSDEAAAREDGLASVAPGLGLSCQVVTEEPDQTVNDDGNGSVDVLIRYITLERNAAKGSQDASYTLRGLVWSLRKFHRGGNEAARQLRGIQLVKVRQITVATLYQPLGNGFVTGAVTVGYDYRDAQLQL